MPTLRPVSKRDGRLAEHEDRERTAALHADWRERALLLTDIGTEADLRQLSDAELHEVLGLDPGYLRNGRLATPLLHEALAHMRRQPHV